MKKLVLAFLFAGATAHADVNSLTSLMTSLGFGGAKLERRFPNHLVVPVIVNNKRAGLLIDTGAPITIIDKNSVNTLGLSVTKTDVQVGGVWGASVERYGVSKLSSIAMGNLMLSNVPVAVANENDMNYFSGLRHMDGLFGAYEMRKFGAIIDCARQMIYINPKGAVESVSQQVAAFLTARGFTLVPMRVNAHHHFEVDGAVNGHPAGFIVDTGSGTTLLTKQKAISFGVVPRPLAFSAEAPSGRVERLNSGTVKLLSIGSFDIPDAEVTLGNLSSGILAGGADIGLLGGEHLAFNFAVIDLGGLALYLRHADKR